MNKKKMRHDMKDNVNKGYIAVVEIGSSCNKKDKHSHHKKDKKGGCGFCHDE